MRLPKSERRRLKAVIEEGQLTAANGERATNNAVTNNDYIDEDMSRFESAIEAVERYLKSNSRFYRKLQRLRRKVWKSSKAKEYFAKHKRNAKKDRAKRERRLNEKMEGVALAMQGANTAFTIESDTRPPRILDFCTSPGAFLKFALECNPTAKAVSFKLPREQDGPVPLLKESQRVEVHMLDITTLAMDMGLRLYQIPHAHPYAKEFFPTWYLVHGRVFDLVICDGQVLGTQRIYRKSRQCRRLLLTQLALGLESLRNGRTIIAMLHRLEHIETIRLLLEFTGFADVVLFKPKPSYVEARRSYFYMVASNVQSTSREAIEAVIEWKREWKVATLGTNWAWRKEKERLAGFGELGIQGVLEQYGPDFLKLGRYIWKRQAEALKKAPYTKT